MPAEVMPGQVELFVTCIVDQFFPEVGEATYRVLNAVGADVSFNPKQTCCGQPAFNSGYWDEARPLARRLLNQYDSSKPVVVPSGSCVAMIRHYYKALFQDDPEMLRRSAALAPQVYEFSEYIASVIGIERLSGLLRDEATETRVAFHESCHAKRELGVDAEPKSILEGLSGVETVPLYQAEVCCGFGGTFSVKYADISGAMLRDKLEAIEASGADVVTACDSSCLMQIRGGLQRRGSSVRIAHLAELTAEGLKGR